MIDTTVKTVTCPNGITVKITPSNNVTFGAKCSGCPLRERCTTNKTGRTLKINRNHDLLAEARTDAQTDRFQYVYKQYRPMVERSIAWLVRNGHRKVRYRGIARNTIGFSQRCAAINLKRLVTLGLDHNGQQWTLT